jgi:hypothetical protein
MMRPYASAATLRAAGPFYRSGTGPWAGTGHRHLGSSRQSCARRRMRAEPFVCLSACLSAPRIQAHTLRHRAGHRQLPQRDQRPNHLPGCREPAAGPGYRGHLTPPEIAPSLNRGTPRCARCRASMFAHALQRHAAAESAGAPPQPQGILVRRCACASAFR